MKKIMKRNGILTLGAAALTLCLVSFQSLAKLSPQEIARLGADLTPLGGEKAGSADGAIPHWTGGIRSPAEAGYPDYEPGAHHPDPYKDEIPLFTITAANMDQYADRLTQGHKAMLKAYPDFAMKVYPSHRSAAFPEWVYEGTRKAAASARLAEGGNGVLDAVGGTPFPIPKNALEAIWNHPLRYWGKNTFRHRHQAVVQRNGDYSLIKTVDAVLSFYYGGENTEDNLIYKIMQELIGPPRIAGTITLVHETLDQAKEPRRGWVYNPGQRRVRRAPNVSFDNSANASDGLMTMDQYDMYNGSPERYHWKLVGKKEIYIPYNTYRLQSNGLKYDDIIRPLHLNPEHLRYELHRVWVVEATLKEGVRHLYKRRTIYLDEDSWLIPHVDQYDNRDQLWRVSEGHSINFYDQPLSTTTVEAHYDLQSGRYIAFGLHNEAESSIDFTADLSDSDFSIITLRQKGRR